MDPSPELLFEIPRGLEQSILLAVLIGFVVTLVLVEAFGWVFVGVVVPGYLASVLVIQPPAGLAVVLDGGLTYVVARALTLVLGRGRASSEFFGRERFFLLVLVSVFVRQHTQTWVWPLAFESIDPIFDAPEDLRRSFSSIGIVLVPLMANILWKLELRRGMQQLVVTTLVTYVVLVLWLLPETTLSYGALELSYEDTAIDFLGNAKAYIIFLCTAYIAAQLNLYYGWDFNGILVPALLGLLWFHPAKIATTFGEAMVVYLITSRLPRAPLLRRINLEGPRRLALIFITSVALKWVMGLVLGDAVPTLKLTDAYGFGYLLPSLLVIKMVKRKSMRAIVLPTAVTSFAGFVVGSLVGFGLSFLDPPLSVTSAQSYRPEPHGSTRLLGSPQGVGALGHLHALQHAEGFPDHAHHVAYRRVWERVADWLEDPSPARHDAVLDAIEGVGLKLVPVGQHEGRAAYALFEGDEGPRQSWDTALLVPGAPGPVLAIPRPVAEAPLAEAATGLCGRLECRAMLIAGYDVERDPITQLSTASFDLARGALREQPTLLVRADPEMGRRPILHVGETIPSSIDLRELWPTEIRVVWTPPPLTHAGSRPELGGTLRFHPDDVDALLAASAPRIVHAPAPPSWVMQRERAPGVRALPHAPPPSREEARYLELELITPLIEVVAGRLPSATLDRLAWRADQLGLRLWRADDCGDGRPCLALVDPLGAEDLGWGSLLLRWGEARAMAVEVPRPGRAFGTQQLGLELWQRSESRAIYIAPGSKEGAFDPLAVGNIDAPLLPFHQALDRSLGDGGTRPLVLQVLGFGAERMLGNDLVIGLGRPVLQERQRPIKLRWLLEQGPLHWVGPPLFSDGSPQLHSLSGMGSPAVEYSLELGQAEVALLWFSPSLRARFARREGAAEERRVQALGLGFENIAELSQLARGPTAEPTISVPEELRLALDELLMLASAYRSSHDIRLLRRIVDQATRGGSFEVSIGRGELTKLPMMLFETSAPDFSLRALVLLDAAVDRRDTISSEDPELRRSLGSALMRRAAVIVVRSEPSRGGGRHAP